MSEALTITGLLFDIVGVVLLFRYAPEKFIDPQTGAFFAVEGKDKGLREEWKKLQPRRGKIALFSVVLIVLGFAFQLLGELLPLVDWQALLQCKLGCPKAT